MRSNQTVEALLDRLDGSGSDDDVGAIQKLRQILGDELPSRLLKRYREARTWRARAACVFRAMHDARTSEEAITLGREAIRDRSKVVRYRAGMLLAYSQRRDLIPELKARLAATSDGEDVSDLRAALDAIECGNVNYFVDRHHSGMVTLTFA